LGLSLQKSWVCEPVTLLVWTLVDLIGTGWMWMDMDGLDWPLCWTWLAWIGLSVGRGWLGSASLLDVDGLD
jgi:hypothetical protein